MIRHLNRRMLAGLVALLLVAGIGFGLVVPHRTDSRTVTAYFSQAVSLFPGTDVDIMGVPVGRVTQVTPEGNRVKVVMQYDPQYSLPAKVKAAIVTPTLIADRFVQLAPAYAGGATLADGAEIPLGRTAVPVEMDQIYKSLSDLTGALGPNGANKHGALGRLLASSAHALNGNGRLGHQMIANLSDAVTTTRGFVSQNKGAVVGDLKSLNTTLSVLAKDRDTLGKVIQLAPLGLGNLTDAWDPASHTEGIRLQVGPTASDLPNILCSIATNDHVPDAPAVCNLFKALIPGKVTSDIGQGISSSGVQVPSLTSGAPSLSAPDSTTPPPSSLGGLLGAVQQQAGGSK
jgi:ABC-type transporter Mla subunit MlaD